MSDTHLGEAGVLGAGVPQDPALEPFAVLDKIMIDIPRLFAKQSNSILKDPTKWWVRPYKKKGKQIKTQKTKQNLGDE